MVAFRSAKAACRARLSRWKRGQEPIAAERPFGCSALLVPDPFSMQIVKRFLTPFPDRLFGDLKRDTCLAVLLAADVFHCQLQPIRSARQLLRKMHLVRDEIVAQIVC